MDADACMEDVPEAYDAFLKVLCSSTFTNHSEEMRKDSSAKMSSLILNDKKSLSQICVVYRCARKWLTLETPGVFKGGGQKLVSVFALLHT